MSPLRRPSVATGLLAGLIALALAGCETTGQPQPPEPAAAAAPPAAAPTLPPAFPPQDLVGRWGLAAYHKPEDRERTETAAANQCRNPYVITLGPSGGVMMYLADQSHPSELALKGAPGGKTFIGPRDEPPGATADREVVSFNGRILILRWMDPEVQSRYGTMVYARCAPEGQHRPARHKAKPKAKPKTKAKPKPKAKAQPAPKPVQQQQQQQQQKQQ
jgi:hypothetical protein